MQSELKPCDFCGSSDHLSIARVGVMTSNMPDRPHRVVCSHIDHDDVQGPVAYGRAEAIAAWNARASDAEITRLTEALLAAEEEKKALLDALGNIRALSAKRQGEGGANETLTHIEGFARQALAGAKPC